MKPKFQKKWIALGKDWFDLYKENIEYVKYVNPWLQAARLGKTHTHRGKNIIWSGYPPPPS